LSIKPSSSNPLDQKLSTIKKYPKNFSTTTTQLKQIQQQQNQNGNLTSTFKKIRTNSNKDIFDEAATAKDNEQHKSKKNATQATNSSSNVTVEATDNATNQQENSLTNELNSSDQTSFTSSTKIHTQLIPIQKFSFFKWEINVDTLVRLFIVA
jgi:hypothetical protein